MKIIGRNSLIYICLTVCVLALVVAGQQRGRGGLFPVAKDGKWGYIDEPGRIVIGPQFDSASGFSDERALVSVRGKVGYIDTAGHLINTPPFDLGGVFSEGLAPINVGQRRNPIIGLITDSGRWGYIDKFGALVIPMKFQEADEFSEGLAAARLGDISGFIDHTGRFVFNAPFDVSSGFSEGIVLVRSNLKMIFLDRTGKRLPTPPLDDNYQPGLSFHEGLAAVQIKEKWGYIDKTGRLVIPAEFLEAGDFSEGLAAAEVPVDQSKETPCMVDGTSSYTDPRKFGYIDHTGKMIIAPQWEYPGPFVGGRRECQQLLQGQFHRQDRSDSNQNSVQRRIAFLGWTGAGLHRRPARSLERLHR